MNQARPSGRERDAGPGLEPDEPIDLAASTLDEEPPYAGATPKAPAIAEPGGPSDLARLRRADRDGNSKPGEPP